MGSFDFIEREWIQMIALTDACRAATRKERDVNEGGTLGQGETQLLLIILLGAKGYASCQALQPSTLQLNTGHTKICTC